MVYGLRSMVYGLRSMVYGLRSMVCGLRSMVRPGAWSLTAAGPFRRVHPSRTVAGSTRPFAPRLAAEPPCGGSVAKQN